MTGDTGTERVLVTGATGFIASHLIHSLLSEKDAYGRSKYKVRGTVRDASDAAKCEPLREMALKIGDAAEGRLELVSANLLADDGWLSAAADCDYVQHLASPVPAHVPANADDVIRPAVEGVERVLAAAAAVPKVKRVVMTSSTAAVYGGVRHDGRAYNEDDWTDTASCPPYEKSKVLAERRVWKLWDAMPGGSRFELVVINPCLVIGPLVMKNPGASLLPVLKTMNREIPMFPNAYFTLVDVRDVATLLLRAMKQPGVSGNRYIACAQTRPDVSFRDGAMLLCERFNPRGYNLHARPMPHCLLPILKLVIPELKHLGHRIGQKFNVDNSKAIETFGIEYIDPKQSFIDAAESCIKFGLVRDPKERGVLGYVVPAILVCFSAAAIYYLLSCLKYV